MNDLITRLSVLTALEMLPSEKAVDMNTVWECEDAIEAIPAYTDVVNPVRCKECKKWDMNNITGRFPDGVRCFCTRMSGAMKGTFTSPNDYCCWGERKEEDTND